jgi:hypothetical protein
MRRIVRVLGDVSQVVQHGYKIFITVLMAVVLGKEALKSWKKKI